MKYALKTKDRLSLSTSIALPVLCCITSYMSIQRANENKHWVEHTYQVLDAINQISHGVKDRQRG